MKAFLGVRSSVLLITTVSHSSQRSLTTLALSQRTTPLSTISSSKTSTASNTCRSHTSMTAPLAATPKDNDTTTPWIAGDPTQAVEAATQLDVWPLDEHNAALLNEVHPRGYTSSTHQPHEVYDLIAIGAGAGGLVSSKQSGRRGAKSAMISEHLAGGDCLNVGCVPSKALIRAARAVRAVRQAAEFGVVIGDGSSSSESNGGDGDGSADTSKKMVSIDFTKIMTRLRAKRTHIAPADGHEGTAGAGAHVYQGRGTFTGPNTVRVADTELTFRTAVVATGGRPSIPNIPGLKEAPYTTNEVLFNLESLPPRMIILGAGVIALEMAQVFATFGSQVTVLQRSPTLFQSKHGDEEAAKLLQELLEQDGVTFVTGSTTQVTTLRDRDPQNKTVFPLLTVTVEADSKPVKTIECECLLVATGRVPNVEHLGLDKANVEYEIGKGVVVNDAAQSVSNPSVYAVGDCVKGVERLTHMSGEMAKLVVQNSLFGDDWKLSSLVVPAVMYTEPEYATAGVYSAELAVSKGMEVDTYRAGLEHNDRAILEGSNVGFCKIFTKKGTDEIVGATIVAERAGEMINEVTLAMKNNLGLRAIGRNIHPYPTTGEAVMGCGIQYINANWERLD